MSNFKKSKKYDQNGSTFKQIIYLDNDRELVGYSKKVGYNEKTDKIAHLKNWILRMYKAGYLNHVHKGTQKEIKTIVYILNGHIEQPLFQLYYKSYEVLSPEWCNNNFKIIQFLDTFYNYITNDQEFKIQRLFDYKTRDKTKKLDPGIKRFLTYKSLHNWIKSELEKKDIPKGELTHFFNRYCSLHFPDKWAILQANRK